MSVLNRLSDLVLGRAEPPQALVLSHRIYAQLMLESYQRAWLPKPDEAFTFLGVPVRRKRLTMFCKNCGAPAEGKACSYCGTDPDEMEVL